MLVHLRQRCPPAILCNVHMLEWGTVRIHTRSQVERVREGGPNDRGAGRSKHETVRRLSRLAHSGVDTSPPRGDSLQLFVHRPCNL